jgi:GNAT superfamily N-acetyltransferase
MKRKLAFALFVALVPALLPGAFSGGVLHSQAVETSAGAPLSSIPASRLAHLRRGINLSHWFAQSRDYSETHLKTHTTERDIALIKSLGFDHVRFTIEPAPLMNETDAARLKPEYLAQLDSALDMLLASGLAVVVDIHPSDEFKIRLRSDDRAVAAFTDFWRSLARHLSARDPERVFLEILNEPMVEDAYRWIGIQARVAAAIREAAPRHTIIATGARWSSVDQLLLLEPLADRNVIYNFHFYEPHNFTHQGATWGADYWPYLKGIPYPSSPELVSNLPPIENQAAQAALKFYGEERWGAERVEKEIELAVDWAQKHNVPLVCNEFGVYRAYAPEAARLRWIEDVRTTLERHGIGWAMWDYAGGFSVVIKKDGSATPDPKTAAALGLRPPPRPVK